MIKEEIILNEEEWENFQPVHELSPEISNKLWNSINKNATSPTVRYSYFRWLAVAASVVLVIGVSWRLIVRKQKTDLIGVETVALSKNIFNNTAQRMTLTLSDGSTVELLPHSKLTYPENFNSLKRDVILNGGANFNIAKDVAKPFTVYSNSVLTTVLGTRFTVKSYEANNTTIILHEGRVMIKIPNSSSEGSKNEYYLTPGDIFILNKVNTSSRTGNTERIATNAERMATQKNIFHDSLSAGSVSANLPSADSLSVRVLHIEKDKDNSYLFNNYPLDVVFDQLQIIYNTTIIYDKSKLGNRSFIGKIDKRDSLYQVLKSIALLNNFSLRKQGDSIIVGAATPY